MILKIKLSAKDLFRFSMIHSYQGQTGIFTAFCVVVGIMMIFRGIAQSSAYYGLMGVLIMVLFVLVTPLTLYMKAKKQAATNPMYKTESVYDMQEDGIHVTIDDQNGLIPWDQIIKIRYNWGMYILYTGKQSAFIFPDEALGSKKDEIMNYIYQHIPASTKLPKGVKRA